MSILRFGTVFVICLMFTSVLLTLSPKEAHGKDGSFGGGTGTPDDPFIIEDVRDLQNIDNNLSAYYVLGNDIDASVTSSWNAGAGFKPIGTWQDRFTGSLDGRNFTITGLFIDRPTTVGVGLIGSMTNSATSIGTVRNLGMVDVDITGNERVGGICGDFLYGLISNCHVTGTVSGNYNVGGLAGYKQGSIYDSYYTGSVSAKSYCGGLVGYNYNSIYNSYSTGSVDAELNCGGLVGYNSGYLFNSHYNVEEVMINSGHHLTMGGLFDDQYQDWMSNGMSLDISDYSSTLVPSGDHYNIGDGDGIRDLLGFADIGDHRFRLSKDIDLSGHPDLYIPYFGGSEFDGDNHTISNLEIDLDFVLFIGMFGYVQSGAIRYLNVVDVDVKGGGAVGALAGLKSGGTVSFCNTSGEVTSKGSAGGLVGSYTYGEVSVCHSACDVNGEGSVGGLVGWKNGGSVYNCHAAGNIDGGFWQAGGLIGYNSGTVTNCSSIGNVRGSDDYVGGLIGKNEWGKVSGCYTTGTVSADRWGVGGFTGYNEGGIVTDCYATGKVIGVDDAVGGFVGQNTGLISNCYSTGNVSGTGTYFGGFAGYTGGSATNCFWDMESSGRTSSYGGTGMTTAEMMTMSAFTDAGWNLDGIWHIVENITYPFLRWQDDGAPTANAGPEQIVYIGPEGEAEVSFDGSGSTDDLGVFNHTWSFTYNGWDVLLYGESVEFVFRAPGLYDVTLKVTDASGNPGTDTMQVAVMDVISPVAYAGPDKIVDEGDTVVFDGNASLDNVAIASYSWSFTDGGPVSLGGARPSHVFDDPGVYVVTLEVADTSDNRDTDTVTVTVIDITNPVANAGEDRTVDQGQPVVFNGSGSTDNVEITNWTWTFTDGDNVTLYGAGPEHIFGSPGVFNVTLHVTDAAGNRDTDSMFVTVMDITPPVARAGADIVVDEGVMVAFNGSGSTDNVGIANWTWTFIDGSEVTLLGAGPAYLFPDPGVFIVILNVTDAAGNWNTDTMTVTVRDITPPVANAGEDRSVPVGSVVHLDGSLSTDNDGILEYSWSFFYEGSNRTLTGVNVTFTFDAAGVYDIKLTVADHFDNNDEDMVRITVVDKGVVNGRVLDEEGEPVEGALVEITASDGKVYTITTGPDGSFSLEVPYGPFAWKISKEGYETISGTGTVAAMGESEIDLSGEPMIREKEVSEDNNILVYLLIAVVIVLIVGFFLYQLMRRKGPGGIEEE